MMIGGTATGAENPAEGEMSEMRGGAGSMVSGKEADGSIVSLMA
jgi:hypothetical protein